MDEILYSMFAWKSCFTGNSQQAENIILPINRNIANLIIYGSPAIEQNIFDTMSFYRDFYCSKKELLK